MVNNSVYKLAIESEIVFKKLLEEFGRFPKTTQTFLELCRFPGRRYEEISSRILRFYLDPNEEHQLGELFLKTLLEIINDSVVLPNLDDVQVELEVGVEGKRLDILVTGNSFVIGIENKLTAKLYNPLEAYSKLLADKAKNVKNVFGIVLSLNPITSEAEKKRMEDNGFFNILYHNWFEKIQQNVGLYMVSGSNKYIVFLYDFINTLKNKETSTGSTPMSKFFLKNGKDIDKLNSEYNKFKADRNSRWLSRHELIKDELNKVIESGSKLWGIYESNDLVIDFKIDNKRIGIEGVFIGSENSIFGEFKYSVTCWESDAKQYIVNELQAKIENIFGKAEIEEPSSRRINLFYTIDLSGKEDDDGDNDKIIESLSKLYDFLKGLYKL
jgi:hypothetical protein